jgi:signal transduction histidine kinase
MLAISEYLRIMKFDHMRASSHMASDFPDLVMPRAADSIAGLLYVPLSGKPGQDFIVLLRKGQSREVQWAGKPYKDTSTGDAASLEPRKSFKTWSETVTGRSRAWTDDQLESAGVLALIYGKFIQVWREKQSAMASNQLTAILLSNTSHAVRTPLSQIINTLELALAGNIDSETRLMLENSHQASRALLFHVHDLLDLTRIETGNETAFNDPFDLRKSIADAVRLYETESHRRGLEFKVTVAPDLPSSVIGDSRKIKTVISNLVANAVKFTDQGYVEVYCGLLQGTGNEIKQPGAVNVEIVISDSGSGIPTDKLQAMFVTLEGAEESSGANGTGLGELRW